MRRTACLIVILSAAALSLRAAEHPGMLVSTTWLRQHLNERHLTLIDVGEAASFEKGHIRRAHFVAASDLVVSRDGIPNELPEPAKLEALLRAAGLPDSGPIVIYARDPIVAARAFFTLDYAGRGDDVSILDGGLAKWEADGLPVEQGSPGTIGKGTLVVRAHPEAVVRLGTMRMLSASAAAMAEGIAIVDARSIPQFRGDEPGAGVAFGGHIDGAVSVPWDENLTGGAIPQFRSIDELRNLYHYAGLADDASVVAYCRTGMQASVTYFVMRLLGRDVHLYDGSWIEWSQAAASAGAGTK